MTSPLRASLPSVFPDTHGAASPQAPRFVPPRATTRGKMGHYLFAGVGERCYKEGPLSPCPPSEAAPTWQARAVVGGVPNLAARPPVLAGRGVAGHVEVLAVLPGVRRLAGALVGAHLVGAGPTVLADGWRDVALVHVLLAVGPVEAGGAPADVVGFKGDAQAPVGTGVGGAGVGLLAGFAWGGQRGRMRMQTAAQALGGSDLCAGAADPALGLCSRGVQLIPPTSPR